MESVWKWSVSFQFDKIYKRHLKNAFNKKEPIISVIRKTQNLMWEHLTDVRKNAWNVVQSSIFRSSTMDEMMRTTNLHK